MNDDERQARIAEIKHRHRTVTENVVWAGICVTCDEQEPCDAMTLLSELDAAAARAERAEAALRRSKRWLEGAEETFAASMDCGEDAYQSAEDCILGDSYCERARDLRRGIAEIDAALAAAPEARDE